MTSNKRFNVHWIDSGREPACSPNPAYPNGINIDDPALRPACRVELDYPARRCGIYCIKCDVCGTFAAVTTAGGPGDPRSVMLPCRDRKIY